MDQTTRPVSLKRAILEGAVIVASILLAFGLEAWWSERQELAESRDLMAALLAEFEEASSELERAVARNGEVIAASDAVLAALRSAEGEASVPTSTLSLLLLTPTTDPRRGNLDGLVSSGDFGLVNSRSLTGSLADWPAALRDLQEEELAGRTFVLETLIPFLVTAIDLPAVFDWRIATTPSHRNVTDPGGTSLARDPAVRLPRSREFINLVATRRYLSRFIVSNAADIQDELEAILLELRRAVER